MIVLYRSFVCNKLYAMIWRPGTWGYLANAFVLAARRDTGIGSLLRPPPEDVIRVV